MCALCKQHRGFEGATRRGRTQCVGEVLAGGDERRVDVAAVLIPVYVLIVTSFKGSAEADPARTWFLPEVWETQNWVRAWDALAAPIGRTVALVIPSSIISAILGSMNGFVLSRWRFPGANVVFTLILFGMFIPYQAVMIPLMKIVLAMGLPQGDRKSVV